MSSAHHKPKTAPVSASDLKAGLRRVRLDVIDRRLLNMLQAGLPLVARPFFHMAFETRISEKEVLLRLRRLRNSGIIRNIGAILDWRELGYQSTLVAVKLPKSQLAAAARTINQHPGVSHNYARNHEYNLWFTLTVPNKRNITEEVRNLLAPTRPTAFLILPAVRAFKLWVSFDLLSHSSVTVDSEDVSISPIKAASAHAGGANDGVIQPFAVVGNTFRHSIRRKNPPLPPLFQRGVPCCSYDQKVLPRFEPCRDESEVAQASRLCTLLPRGGADEMSLSEIEKKVAGQLRKGIPLVSRPFRNIGGRVGLSEDHLLSIAKSLLRRGIIRRLGAQLRHRAVGFKANAMCCWRVPASDMESAGRVVSSFSCVSHCFERRPCLPEWPYNLFAMIHHRRRAECETSAREISRRIGVRDYVLLFSTREFKKERVSYSGEFGVSKPKL